MAKDDKVKNDAANKGAVPITWIDYVLTFGFVLIALILGLVFVGLSVTKVGLAILWAFACMVSGTIIGFLFGIPRVLQQDNVQVPVEPPTGANQNAAIAPANYRQQVNTNLEQISDWLTKIIVGIGLVELRRLPELLNRGSAFIASGLGANPESKTVAAAIIVYFGIIGFLGGYTVTRIYLAGAFKRADTGEGGMLMVGGNELEAMDALKQQGKLIKDLLERTAQVQPGPTTGSSQSAETLGEKVMAGKTLAVKSILWVDDNPKNNSYLMDSLESKGIEIVTATSTTEALEILGKRSFDRIISDLGRKEGNTYIQTAGIDLIKQIRAVGLNIPVIVYCSEQAAAKFRQQALDTGANEVTASPSFLLNALHLNV